MILSKLGFSLGAYSYSLKMYVFEKVSQAVVTHVSSVSGALQMFPVGLGTAPGGPGPASGASHPWLYSSKNSYWCQGALLCILSDDPTGKLGHV